MKNRLITLLFASLLGLCAFAQTISEPVAHSRAAAFFANQAQQAPGAIRDASHDNDALSLAYTSQGNGNTRFYVYNRGKNGGFVIIGGNESVQEILAYSYNGHFDSTLSNPNLKWWVESTEDGISRALQNRVSYQTLEGDSTHVAPLLTTTWGQSWPYNAMTPTVAVGDSMTHCVTGCVATAMAQLVNYHQYPTVGIGQKTYISQVSGRNVRLHFDFANTLFDWTNMRDNYSGQYTEVEKNAVATLMYACGVAVGMNYGLDGSGALAYNVAPALRNYFGYIAKSKPSFTYEVIQSELSHGNPLLYAGTSDEGHMMVIDGYDNQGLLHLNMGWDGAANAYYAMNDMGGYTNQPELITVHVPSAENPNDDQTITFDGITYELFGYNQTAFATGLQNNQIDSITIPSEVDYNGVLYDVVRVDNFGNDSNLRKVILSEGIRVIGQKAFASDINLIEVSIPTSVNIIEGEAFLDCSSLQQIELSRNVEEFRVGDRYYRTFGGCSSLSQIVIDSLNPFFYIYDGAIYNRIKNSLVESLPTYNQPLYIKEGTEIIERFACSYTNIPEFIFPNSIRLIGTGAFYGNNRMKRLVLPDSEDIQYETLRWSIFNLNDSLEYIYIPKGLKIIPDGEFDCPRIKTIVVSEENPNYMALNNILYSKDTVHILKAGIEIGDSIFLPQSTRTIAMKAFMHNKMKYIDISHIEAFNDEVFWDCANLESIEIPEGIQFIPTATFTLCKNLKEITLPSTLEGIFYMAFSSCDKLLYVNCNFTQPFPISDDLYRSFFQTYGQLTVPQGCKSAFENAELWKNFTIVEKSDTPLVGKIDSIKITASRPYLVNGEDSIQIFVQVFPDSISVDNVAFAFNAKGWGNIITINDRGIVKMSSIDRRIYHPEIIAYATDGSKVYSNTIPIDIIRPVYDSYKVKVYIDGELVKEDYGRGSYSHGGPSQMSYDEIKQFVADIDTVREEMEFSGWTNYCQYVDEGYRSILTLIIRGSFSPKKYTITYILNEDNYWVDRVAYGEMPVYTGPIPTKTATAQYSYTFKGWQPEIIPVVADATYVATYEAIPISAIPNVPETRRPKKIFRDNQLYILLPDGTRYDSTGKKVE